MSKKIMLFVIVAFVLTFTLSACHSTTGKSSNQLAENKSMTMKDTLNEKNETSNTKENTKIILKNVNASITVKNSEKAISSISNWIDSNGGYEFSRSSNAVKNNTRINVVYKIQPDKLQSFVEILKEFGNITSCDIKSDDITDQYYDVAARLESLKKGREQFLEILKKANTIDEILKVQDQINKISGDIESLQGKINLWDKMASESTITLSITEESDPIKDTTITWNFTSFQDIFKIMKNGFVITSNIIVNFISWIFIIIVSIIPLLILAGIMLIIFLYIKKRKKQ